jgi:hypothetical protein
MNMDKLALLNQKCRCGLELSINRHRTFYITAKEWFAEQESNLANLSDLDADVRAEMIQRDSVVDLWFYPKTPIGFYHILHFDLEIALTEALAVLEKDGRA